MLMAEVAFPQAAQDFYLKSIDMLGHSGCFMMNTHRGRVGLNLGMSVQFGSPGGPADAPQTSPAHDLPLNPLTSTSAAVYWLTGNM